MNLEQMLQVMTQADEGMTEDIDVQALVGDIRDKVDGIKDVIDRLEGFEAFLRSKVKGLEASARAAKNNVRRLKEYTQRSLEANHFEKLPGDLYRVQIQAGADTVEFLRNPVPSDYTSGMVDMTVSYQWNVEKVLNVLKTGDKLEFATLKKNSHVRWYLNNERRADKKSRKVKSQGVIDVESTDASDKAAGCSLNPEPEPGANSQGSAEKPHD